MIVTRSRSHMLERTLGIYKEKRGKSMEPIRFDSVEDKYETKSGVVLSAVDWREKTPVGGYEYRAVSLTRGSRLIPRRPADGLNSVMR
jgi:hypothetical protein